MEENEYEPYTVFYGEKYHEHFEDKKEAIECFLFGLTSKCRLKIEYYGRESYKQILEYQTSDGKWKADSEYGALFKPFWKKKTIKYFQNNLL